MLVIKNRLRCVGSVLAVSAAENRLALLDSSHNFYLYDLDTFDLSDKKALAPGGSPRHPYDRSFALSPRFDLLLSDIEAGRASLFSHAEGAHAAVKLEFNDKPLYVCEFSRDGNTLALGGEDGKLFLYDMQRGLGSSLLKTRPDYISSVAFSSNDRYMAISSFDRSTLIYDRRMSRVTASFELDFAVERACFIQDDSKIVLITRHKYAVLYDMASGELITSAFEFSDWPTAMAPVGEEHLVIATRADELYLINHRQFRLKHTVTLEKSGVTQLHAHEGLLVVTHSDGEVAVVDTEAYLQELNIHLRINRFEEASRLLKENIFLSAQPAMKKYDKLWPSILQKAKNLLLQGAREEADALVEPFFFDNAKREEYELCLASGKDCKRFQELIAAKEYAEAFKLSDEKPFLKKGKEYEMLENSWLKLYQGCKQLFARNDLESVTEAKKRLRPYAAVSSKRTLVDELVNNYKIFNRSDELVKQRDFKAYFQLVEQYPFLKSEEVFNRVMQIGERTFVRLKTLELEGAYEEALNIGRYLYDFIPMRPGVKGAVEMLENRICLDAHIAAGRLKEAYALVEKFPQLELCEAFERFHATFTGLLEKARDFAQTGQMQHLKRLLSDYIRIPYTMHTVATVVKEAYLEEIRQAWSAQDKRIDWKATFAKYGAYFGMENDLLLLAKQLEFEDLIEIDDKSSEQNGYEKLAFEDSVLARHA